jgi:hypothetical protein
VLRSVSPWQGIGSNALSPWHRDPFPRVFTPDRGHPHTVPPASSGLESSSPTVAPARPRSLPTSCCRQVQMPVLREYARGRRSLSGFQHRARCYGLSNVLPAHRSKFTARLPQPESQLTQWPAWVESEISPCVVARRYKRRIGGIFGEGSSNTAGAGEVLIPNQLMKES